MSTQISEDEQNLKRKSRRRLVGAVALTLAVVVVLPMLLDNEPKPMGQNIDLNIPSPDKVGAFVPRVTPSKVLAELPVSAPIAVPPSSIQAVSAVVVPTAIASGGTIAKNSADTAVHHAVTDSKLTEKIDTPSVTPSPENFVIQVGAFSNAASAHKMLGSLKEWSFKAYSEKSNDKIRVRVGPYSDKEKANKVKLLLEKHGLHPTIIPLA